MNEVCLLRKDIIAYYGTEYITLTNKPCLIYWIQACAVSTGSQSIDIMDDFVCLDTPVVRFWLNNKNRSEIVFKQPLFFQKALCVTHVFAECHYTIGYKILC